MSTFQYDAFEIITKYTYLNLNIPSYSYIPTSWITNNPGNSANRGIGGAGGQVSIGSTTLPNHQNHQNHQNGQNGENGCNKGGFHKWRCWR